jgi:excinuclease UvrABC nuclease subunit
MMSSDLVAYGFVSWYALNRQNERVLLGLVPQRPGVYAMRCRNPQRVLGKSDVVYFGKATNVNGLRGRLRQYFHPGPTQRTNVRLLAEFGDCADFEISFIETALTAATALEDNLIAAYEVAHGDLPPWNKRH